MRIRQVWTPMLSCVVAVMLSATSHAATLVIDSFDNSSLSTGGYPTDTGFRLSPPTTRPTVLGVAGFFNQDVTDTLNTGVMPGATRAGRLAYVSGTNFISATVNPVPGTFNISSVNDTGTVQLEYSVASAFQPVGSGGAVVANLSSYSAIQMDIDFFNPALGNGEVIRLRLEDGDSSSAVLAQPIAVGLMSWNLADPAFAGITMSDVRRIFFEFQISQGTDVIVDFIQATDVPEPSTWVLWGTMGLGLAVGACVHRRRKK